MNVHHAESRIIEDLRREEFSVGDNQAPVHGAQGLELIQLRLFFWRRGLKGRYPGSLGGFLHGRFGKFVPATSRLIRRGDGADDMGNFSKSFEERDGDLRRAE